MPTATFSAVILIRGVNPYVRVVAARAAKLQPGWRKPMPVLVRLNGQPADWHRINLMPVGEGSFYLYLNGIVRTAAGAAVGDRVRVELRFDAAYRGADEYALPPWMGEQLDRNPPARRSWEALAPSRQKEIVRYLLNLKSEAARRRNADRLLQVLSGRSERFLARHWSDGA